MDILNKFIRWPWEVPNPETGRVENDIDREIWQDLTTNLGFDPIFKQQPRNLNILQALALPTVMYLEHTRFFENRPRPNPWREYLTDDERKQVLDYYYVHDQAHTVLYQLLPHKNLIPHMAAYMAGVFAFTTWNAAQVFSLEEIMEEFTQSNFGEDTYDMQAFKEGAVVFVTGITGAIRGLKTMSGSMYSLFDKRMNQKRLTVFLDDMRGGVKNNLQSGKVLDRETLDEELGKSEIGRTRLTEFLTGSCTYVAVPGKPQEKLNECWFPVYF